jgi:hypothetical protein
MTGMCNHAGCFRSGTWRDDDDGRGYCGEHIIFVRPAPEDTKRADFSADYARDAARGEP